MMHPLLEARLRRVVARRRRLVLWCQLAGCWGGAALLGLGWMALQRQSGWSSALALPVIAMLGVTGALIVAVRHRRTKSDWREVVRQIETRHPELDGRLLTAAQQQAKAGGDLNYLQHRLVQEAVLHSQTRDWAETIPTSRVTIAQGAHLLALVLFGVVLWELRATGGHSLLVRDFGSGITVTPGDTSLEHGDSLVVLARFSGALPASVDLVVGPSAAVSRRIPLAKSLADPMFGGSVPEVASNLVYHVAYAGRRTRDFQVIVFEYPRLERADADLTFPEYTGQPPKRIADTRRLSAVEGSRLDLTLQLNKPVVAARLVAKDKGRQVIPLLVETNRARAALKQFPLETSRTYELQLVDADGRTNKSPAQFVFDALKNRPPELRLASPRGDLRPSPLEEVSFDGTVWDDFGVPAYGLGYTLAGQEPKFVELGRAVPAKEKRPFHYVLRLEDLGLQPDQLVSWFVWADDLGPDGRVRRTPGDLFFAEVRPFDEIFREGQGMAGGSQEQSGGMSGEPGNQTGRLAELQKQIISATWKLQREHGGAAKPPPEAESAPANGPQPAREAAPPAKQSTAIQPALERGAEAQSAASPPGNPRHSRLRPGAAALHLLRAAGGQALQALSLPPVAGQVAAAESPPARAPASDGVGREQTSTQATAPKYADDAAVVRDSEQQALEQAKATQERQQDPRAAALWSAAIKNMETALANLQRATGSPASLPEALAAEQAAYQALLKLQEHEYQVNRARQNRGQQGGRPQQMQRQLDQLDLTQSEDRYETQRQAQAPPTAQRREQLQVMNRLQELARRQSDLNDRLQELQTALQEARTPEERAEIQRRLKRLQEEEQQMLADVDEVRQRMDRPENQSRMTDERRQLDQTREDVQRAAEAAGQGAASQALASGTRAQRQLQDVRDQMRKENASRFADDLRNLRGEARELARQQEEIARRMETESGRERTTLSDSPDRKDTLDQLARQKERLTNLVERATQVSEQAEEPEPLLSRQLYDTVRQFTQDSARNVKETQDELLSRGLMTRTLYDRFKDTAEPDGAKLLDVTSEMLRQDFLPQASQAGQRARAGIDDLKRGVERAAGSVLGDDTEALRLARQELDQLTDQLNREVTQAAGGAAQTNRTPARTAEDEGRRGASEQSSNNARLAPGNNSGRRSNQTAQAGGRTAQPSARAGDQANAAGQGTPTQSSEASSASESAGRQANDTTRQNDAPQSDQPAAGSQGRGGEQSQTAQTARAGGTLRDGPRRGGVASGGWRDAGGGGDGGDLSGSLGRNLDRLLDEQGAPLTGPITGDDFAPWSDRLRDVEEMIELPELRNEVAAARERARLLRREFKRDLKKPDWAIVRLQVMQPLVQVRDQITDELARRESREALVPIDRDPVPSRYSELVRRYYEELGKDKP